MRATLYHAVIINEHSAWKIVNKYLNRWRSNIKDKRWLLFSGTPRRSRYWLRHVFYYRVRRRRRQVVFGDLIIAVRQTPPAVYGRRQHRSQAYQPREAEGQWRSQQGAQWGRAPSQMNLKVTQRHTRTFIVHLCTWNWLKQAQNHCPACSVVWRPKIIQRNCEERRNCCQKMRQKLFAGGAPPGPTGRAYSTPKAPLLDLTKGGVMGR